MRLRVFPQDDEVLQQLAQLTDQVQEAVRCCSELIGAEDDRLPELRALMERIGTRSADLHFGAMTTSRTSYVLPLPRADLYLLSGHLARAVESLLHAAEALIDSPRRRRQGRGTTEQLATISRMTSLSRTAVLNLASLEGLDEYWFDLHRLRKQTERTHQAQRVEHFERLDVAEAVRQQQITDQLYESARALSALAHEIGRITVSEA